MADRKLNFIIIDDNKLDCFIEQRISINAGISENIHLFLDASEALELVRNGGGFDNDEKTVIIVDIQMPLMNGFEFVEAFEALPVDTQEKYRVFMLSSSINENDLNRVRNYKSVIQIISKPLSIKKVAAFIE